MKQPINYAGTYPNNWAGYVFKEALGYTSGRHTGVDYNGAGAGNADLGMPIVAIASGRVVDRKMNGQIGGFGNCIIIETPNCPPNATGNKLFHRYLHMNSVDVNVGQEVREGQRVGTVGNYTIHSENFILPPKVAKGSYCRFNFVNTYKLNPLRSETETYSSEYFLVK